LYVEADEVGAQQSIQQFPLPGADGKGFRCRPWDVPKNGYPRIRSFPLDHSGQQREMIVLYQDDGLLGTFHFFKQSVGEFAIDVLVLLPVVCAKDRTRVGDM